MGFGAGGWGWCKWLDGVGVEGLVRVGGVWCGWVGFGADGWAVGVSG